MPSVGAPSQEAAEEEAEAAEEEAEAAVEEAEAAVEEEDSSEIDEDVLVSDLKPPRRRPKREVKPEAEEEPKPEAQVGSASFRASKSFVRLSFLAGLYFQPIVLQTQHSSSWLSRGWPLGHL